jgi:hypothetical protein
VRKFKLTFERGTVNPDGVDKVAILVNKQFPGPTLTVDLGDQVVIELHNNLDDVSLLHVHGMLQIGSPGQDGVQWVTQNPAPGALQTEGLPQPDSDPNAPPSYMYSFIASVPGKEGRGWGEGGRRARRARPRRPNPHTRPSLIQAPFGTTPTTTSSTPTARAARSS